MKVVNCPLDGVLCCACENGCMGCPNYDLYLQLLEEEREDNKIDNGKRW